MEYAVIGCLIWGIVWGVVVNKVIENKGYEENWFWWGFFFGIFALIVAVTKQNAPRPSEPVIVEQSASVVVAPELCIGEISVDRIDINSAIHIVSWDVQKESSTDCTISIDFFNLSPKIITAVLFAANGLNSFGDPILIEEKETFDILGQDIYVKPGKYCNIKVKLPNQDIRKVKLVVKKVCYSDGEIAQTQPNRWIATRQTVIEQKYTDCIKRKNPKGAYYAIIEDKYWQCTCGFVNVGHTCLACGMGKLMAYEFTAEKIEGTYQQHLNLVEAEKKAEEERKKESERKAAEAAIKAEQHKKALVKRWIIAGCATLVGIALFFVASQIKKEHDYKAEMIQISDCIEKEEYDTAFSIMISSKSYEKIADSYGDVLWEKQKELDEAFNANPWDHAWDIYAVFDTEQSRDGICYYCVSKKTEYGESEYFYAVLENGEKHKLLTESYYTDDGYVLIDKLGSDWNDDREYALYSNGWLFLNVAKKDYSREDNYYAVKYDKEQKKTLSVALPDDLYKAKYLYKMKDGNILISTEARVASDTMWLFDVVKGTIQEISHSQMAKRYGDIISQNNNTLYEKYIG